MTPTTLRRFCTATLLMLILVMVAGATVRLTDSGLGCENWPACESDSFTPRGESDIHAVIEFVNRLVSGLVGVAALAAVVGSHRRSPRRQDLVTWSWLVMVMVVVNALVGALVVETELLPATVILHFLLAIAALGGGVVLRHLAGLPDAPDPPGVPDAGPTTPARPRGAAPTSTRPGLRGPAHLVALATVVVVVLGTLVTGAGPHAGDEAADRLDIDIGSVAQLHGVAALILLLITIWFATLARRERAPVAVTDRVRWLTFALLTQGAIGYTQYFTGVPRLLVGAHVLGSALVWVAALLVWLSVLRAAPPAGGDHGRQDESRDNDVRDDDVRDDAPARLAVADGGRSAREGAGPGAAVETDPRT